MNTWMLILMLAGGFRAGDVIYTVPVASERDCKKLHSVMYKQFKDMNFWSHKQLTIQCVEINSK